MGRRSRGRSNIRGGELVFDAMASRHHLAKARRREAARACGDVAGEAQARGLPITTRRFECTLPWDTLNNIVL